MAKSKPRNVNYRLITEKDEPTPSVEIVCPPCGQVSVFPDVFDNGKPVSGLCPTCGERLYFA